jgi:hypothetical protein
MNLSKCWLTAGLLFLLPTSAAFSAEKTADADKPTTADKDKPPAADAVAAVVESSLKSAGGHIRQFAFDGNADTFFASEENPKESDHFTLTFDKPVAVKSITVATGRTNGDDKLEAGQLEVSADGKKFESIAKFTDGAANANTAGRQIAAVRIHPADLKHPLVIREIDVDSKQEVAKFKYPVEFIVDVSDAPEMQEWADKCIRVCERAYPMINEQLASDGFRPARVVHMTLKKMNGVAYTGGTHITGAVKWFKDHPDDVGAMVHETVHVVQAYRGRGNPGWLVEGVADYIRFFKYEPGHVGPISADRSHYNGSYRVTASFLAYLVDTYDPQIVKKLNEAMRTGKYNDQLFKTYTGKDLEELDDQWRSTLKRKKS